MRETSQKALSVAKRTAVRVLVVVALVFCGAVPAQAATVVAHGHTPDAVTDRDGTTHLVWSEYRAQRTTDTSNSAQRVDIVHYCKIPRGSTSCTGEKTFSDCIVSDSELPANQGTPVGLDPWGPHVMISSFGDVVITSTRYCRYMQKGDAPDAFRERIETHAWSSGDNGETFASLGWVGYLPAGTYSPNSYKNSDPGTMSPSRPLFDAADRRTVMPYSAYENDATGFAGGAWLESDPIPSVQVLAPDPVVGSQPSGTAAVHLGTGVTSGVNVAQRGRNSFVAAWTEITQVNGFPRYKVKIRTYDCADCPLASFGADANWSPVQTIDQAINARVVSGPSGTFVTYQRASDGSGTVGLGLFTRPVTGTTVGAETQSASGTVQPDRYDLIEDPSGRFYAALQETRVDDTSRQPWLSYRGSLDGVTWTDRTFLDLDQTATPVLPVVSARVGDQGLIGYVFWTLRYPTPYNGSGDEPILMAPIPGSGEAPPDPGPTPDPGPAPGPGPTPDPGTPPPTPPPDTGACKILQFASVDVVADACLTRKGSVYTAKGRVRVNGMSIAATEITFDTKLRTVVSQGPATVKLGDTVLFKSPIDWELPAGNTVKLPSIDTGDAGGKLSGFPLKGSIDVKLVRGGVEIALHLGLPKIFGGVTGDVTVRADNLAGIHVREIHVKAGKALVGPLEVSNLEFLYNPDEKKWSGGAKLGIPPRPPAPELESHVGFVDGDLDYLRNELTFPGEGIPLDTFNAVHLTKIRFSLATKPDLQLSGGVTFSAGPKYGDVHVADIDGDMTFTFPDGKPAILRADGTVSLLTVPVGSAYLQYRTDGLVNLGGRVDLSALDIFSLHAQIEGWILAPKAFSIYGTARVCVGDLGCAGGEIEFSSIGIAACAEIGPVDAGIGFKWGNPALWTPAWIFSVDVMLSGCGVGDYQPAAPAAARAGAARVVKIDAGLPSAIFSIVGRDAPPHVTLVDPAGKRIEAPGDHSIETPELAVGHVPSKKLTIVALKKPASGTWKIEPADDSSPIVSAGHANGLPQPSVSAKVTGKGRNRVLHYKVKPLDGQKLSFEERGADGTAGVIGTAHGRKGKLRFSPASGAKGKRTIIARVESFGKPRTQLRVASYIAPPPPKPAKPKGLKIKRKGKKLTVTWKPIRAISRYRLMIKLTDGRTLLFLPKAKQKTMTLKGVRKKVKATASLRGERADGTTGPVATYRLRK